MLTTPHHPYGLRDDLHAERLLREIGARMDELAHLDALPLGVIERYARLLQRGERDALERLRRVPAEVLEIG